MEADLFYDFEVYPDSDTEPEDEEGAETKALSMEHPILCDLDLFMRKSGAWQRHWSFLLRGSQ